MKLKGIAIIELTDVNTGEKETVREENMATNAVNHLLGTNPFGVFFRKNFNSGYQISAESSFLPICPKLIGGVQLFPQRLEEAKDGYYPPSSNVPTGYASNDVNGTENTKRGSLNLVESKKLENGYQFVWDFLPSQGNGTIAALGLTTLQGGTNAYGSQTADSTAYLQLLSLRMTSLSDEIRADLLRVVEIDFEKEILYAIGISGKTLTLTSYRIPIFSLGLNDLLDNTTLTVLQSENISCSSFAFKGSSGQYGDFFDGRDGYWYGFANQANTSGNASVSWIKIRKEDHSITEGEWTLSDAKLDNIGRVQIGTTSSTRETRAALKSGFLYVPASDKTGIYKINVSNQTDISFIPFGFTSQLATLGTGSNGKGCLQQIGDLIVGSDFQILSDDTAVPIAGNAKLDNIGGHVFQYRNFLIYFGNTGNSMYQNIYMLTPFLATINNLATPLVKTADKTMKITYRLTQET